MPAPWPHTARTDTTMTDAMPNTSALRRLMVWLSPAFPTGGFAYSHGLEWAVEAGDVVDRQTLHHWLADILRHGGGRSDAILFRHAHATAADVAGLRDLAELAAALGPSRERRAETLGQGGAFAAALAPWPTPPLAALGAEIGADRIAYPVAVGAACGAHGIPADAAAGAYLTAFTANLISAAVRLIPLGQSAGVAALAGLEAVIEEVATATAGATLDDLGGACFRADITAMRHETQYTRLFRS